MARRLSKLEKQELRILLVGMPGVGKSATGNTILRRKAFPSMLSSSLVTTEFKKEKGAFDGQSLAVIDTPSLFPTNPLDPLAWLGKTEELKEAVRCISLAAPGPHVFLVVIQLRRLTREEQKTVETIQGAFGREVGGYTMVLFTHGDDWDPKEIIRQFPCISNLIQQCHGGYHVFNNRSEDPSQVAELLEKIKNMVQRNGGRHFTHEKLEEAEEAISQEMRRLMRNDPDLTREEVRKMAERNNAFIRKGLGVFGVFGAAVETIAGACIIQ